MKKSIIISSLSMRFPLADGWTLELLKKYVSHHSDPEAFTLMGEFITSEDERIPYDTRYYFARVGTILDIQRLFEDGHIGELIGKDSWGELKGLSDLEILKRRNW